MAEDKGHKIAAFEDPDSEDPPLLGVIIGSVEPEEITAEEWRERTDKTPASVARGGFILNTYSGALMIMGDSGYWRGDFGDLPELLADTEGYSANE